MLSYVGGGGIANAVFSLPPLPEGWSHTTPSLSLDFESSDLEKEKKIFV